MGKLFFLDATTNIDYRCSASVVVAPNKRTVLTAAHCLFDPSRQVGYVDHFFAPAYVDGNAPYGVWDMAEYIVHDKWVNEGKLHFDYGFMRMTRDDGVHIQDVVGALGFAWNQTNGFIDAMGYPANPPYDGERQKRDFTNSTIVDFANDGGGVLEGWFDEIISDFGGGSSGGPFVRDYNPQNRLGFARGVNSFRIPDRPYVYSAYFDGDAKVGKDFAGESGTGTQTLRASRWAPEGVGPLTTRATTPGTTWCP
ncbi:trypsin-like serine peptidase [Herbihabitans rhizosphaerae]|uniref:trypsin-like serine peptidase n=1 Tax=Herbihabitans rhizosphaerae TaxID=1872711 RepID=UPI0013EE5F4D|nr:trypsin-like serine protease [Herbihabitans rhizosphaerae]